MKNLNITLFGDYFVGNSFSKIEIQNIYNYLKNNDLNIINYGELLANQCEKQYLNYVRQIFRYTRKCYSFFV